LNDEIRDLRSEAAKKMMAIPVAKRASAQKTDPEIYFINKNISSIKTKIENLGQSIERAKCSLEETPQTEGDFLDFIRNIFK
jgi:phage-related protein